MSFFADLLGNLALTGEKVVDDKIAQQQRLDQESRQNDMAIARQKAIDANRLALEDQRVQEKQQRISQQMAKVEEQTPEVSRARQLLEAQGRAPSVDGNVLDIIKSKLTPEELKKHYGVKNDQLSKLDDQLTVARKGGMYDAEAELKAARAETVKAIAEDWKRTYEQGRLDNDTIRAEASKTHAEALLKRAENAGAADGEGKSFKTLETADGKVYRITRNGMEELPIVGKGLPDAIAKQVASLRKDNPRVPTGDPKQPTELFNKLPVDKQMDIARQYARGSSTDKKPTDAKPAESKKSYTTSNWEK